MSESKEEKIIKHIRSLGRNEIEQISGKLGNITNDSIPRLPEEVFVQYFLPFFAGEKVHESITINLWFGIAGNPYMPVRIVNKAGEVLYTIPAFFERGVIDINSVDKRAAPLAHVLATTEQLSHQHPKRGARYLENQLGMRNIAKEDSSLMGKNMSAWIDIFKRYGKPIPESFKQESATTENKDTTPTENKSVEIQQPLEYDDDIL